MFGLLAYSSPRFFINSNFIHLHSLQQFKYSLLEFSEDSQVPSPFLS